VFLWSVITCCKCLLIALYVILQENHFINNKLINSFSGLVSYLYQILMSWIVSLYARKLLDASNFGYTGSVALYSPVCACWHKRWINYKLCMGKKSKQSMSGELFINQLIDIVQTYPSYLVVSLRSTSFVGIWFAYIHFLWPYCHCFALQYSLCSEDFNCTEWIAVL